MWPVELVEVVVLDMRRDDGNPAGGAIVCGETEPGIPWCCWELEACAGSTLDEVVRVRLWMTCG